MERSISSLKSFQPLEKSLSRTRDSQRGSIALRGEYAKSMDRLNEILQAKADRHERKRGSQIYKLGNSVKKSFNFALTCLNPLPQKPTWLERLTYAFRLPPHGLLGKWLTGVFTICMIYCALYSIFKDKATPLPKCEKDRINQTSNETVNCYANIFGLFVTIGTAMIVGSLFQMLYLPPLLGMLLTGIVFGNLQSLNVTKFISNTFIPILRKLSLVVILTRAGMCLDPKILRSLSAAVFRLAFIPCLGEACACALVSYFILGYGPAWGFTLGFVLGAVSPAVVVLSMLKLEGQGYGVEKGIPTLVIAAASMDDVLAISGHSFAMGIALPPVEEMGMAWKIIKGPIEVLSGIAYGVIIGVLSWYLPHPKHDRLILFRVIILLAGGISALLGSKVVHLPAAGAVGCLTLSFVAGVGWRERDGWRENFNPLISVIDTIWWIAQPTLFSLIGAEINFAVILGKGLWLLKAVGLIGLSLLGRMIISFIVVCRTGLDFQEMLFVSLAWIPKATVQAAIGPLAKDVVHGMSKMNEADEKKMDHLHKISQEILIIGCLSILLTAPLGAFLISFFGPRLLKKVKYNEPDKSDLSLSNKIINPEEDIKKDNSSVDEILSDIPLFEKIDNPAADNVIKKS